MAIGDRKLGSFSVPPVGLGCMVLSHAYGVPPSREQGEAVLDACAELGIAFVAFSPQARGFLTGTNLDPTAFAENYVGLSL